jgi:hypothetical protein
MESRILLNAADYEAEGIKRKIVNLIRLKSISGVRRADLPSSQMDCLLRGPEFARHPHQVGEGVRFHFLHHLPAVCLYRDFADTELAADLFIQ